MSCQSCFWFSKFFLTQQGSVLLNKIFVGPISLSPATAPMFGALYPSIIFCLSKVGSWRQQVQQGNLEIPLTSDTFHLLLGDLKAFPGQMGHVSPPACSGSAPGASCWLYMTEKPPKIDDKVASLSDVLTRSADSFRCGEAVALNELLPDGQAPLLISKSEPSYTPKETNFSRLYMPPHSFGLVTWGSVSCPRTVQHVAQGSQESNRRPSD